MARRAGWALLGVCAATLAGLEVAGHGTATLVAVIALFVAPDLSFLAGAGGTEGAAHGQLPLRAVPLYNAMHRVWLPLVALVGCAVGPLEWAPIFAGALAWLTHIAIDRAAGYGLRDRSGLQRG